MTLRASAAGRAAGAASAAASDGLERPRRAFNRWTGSAAGSTVAAGTASDSRGAGRASGGRGGRTIRRSLRAGLAGLPAGVADPFPVTTRAVDGRPGAPLGSSGRRGARGAVPSMTVSGPWTRTSSSGRSRAGSRMSSPHHGHSVNHPWVGAAQLQHRPGGARWRRASAAGPRIAPNTTHVCGLRRRRSARRAAAPPNPPSHAATRTMSRRSMPHTSERDRQFRGRPLPRRPLEYGTASSQGMPPTHRVMVVPAGTDRRGRGRVSAPQSPGRCPFVSYATRGL